MQVLPGHPLADQEYTIKESELHVRQILVVTTRGLKDRRAFRQNKRMKTRKMKGRMNKNGT